MGLALADRVKETTTTTGTGTVNLGGAQTGYQTFVSGVGTGSVTDYCIADQGGANWEVGTGTVTSGAPDTLTRTTVWASSNAGALVNFGAGTKDVFCIRRAGSVPTYVGKSAPEARQSTTTLAADASLVFTVGANLNAAFEMQIMFNTPTTGGFKYDLNSTGTGVAITSAQWMIPPGATAMTNIAADTAFNVVRNTVVAGNSGYLRLQGEVSTDGGVASTIQFRWAQQSSQASNTQVNGGSWLSYRIF